MSFWTDVFVEKCVCSDHSEQCIRMRNHACPESLQVNYHYRLIMTNKENVVEQCARRDRWHFWRREWCFIHWSRMGCVDGCSRWLILSKVLLHCIIIHINMYLIHISQYMLRYLFWDHSAYFRCELLCSLRPRYFVWGHKCVQWHGYERYFMRTFSVSPKFKMLINHRVSSVGKVEITVCTE